MVAQESARLDARLASVGGKRLPSDLSLGQTSRFRAIGQFQGFDSKGFFASNHSSCLTVFGLFVLSPGTSVPGFIMKVLFTVKDQSS